MNRKMIALVMVVVIGVLAVSAFSWTPDHDSNHEGLNVYHLSERSSYAEFYLLATNQQGMAIYHQSEWNGSQPALTTDLSSPNKTDAADYRWDAMAKFYAGDQGAVPVVYGPPGR